jgi:hypothetical protein
MSPYDDGRGSLLPVVKAHDVDAKVDAGAGEGLVLPHIQRIRVYLGPPDTAARAQRRRTSACPVSRAVLFCPAGSG